MPSNSLLGGSVISRQPLKDLKANDSRLKPAPKRISGTAKKAKLRNLGSLQNPAFNTCCASLKSSVIGPSLLRSPQPPKEPSAHSKLEVEECSNISDISYGGDRRKTKEPKRLTDMFKTLKPRKFDKRTSHGTTVKKTETFISEIKCLLDNINGRIVAKPSKVYLR